MDINPEEAEEGASLVKDLGSTALSGISKAGHGIIAGVEKVGTAGKTWITDKFANRAAEKTTAEAMGDTKGAETAASEATGDTGSTAATAASSATTAGGPTSGDTTPTSTHDSTADSGKTSGDNQANQKSTTPVGKIWKGTKMVGKAGVGVAGLGFGAVKGGAKVLGGIHHGGAKTLAGLGVLGALLGGKGGVSSILKWGALLLMAKALLTTGGMSKINGVTASAADKTGENAQSAETAASQNQNGSTNPTVSGTSNVSQVSTSNGNVNSNSATSETALQSSNVKTNVSLANDNSQPLPTSPIGHKSLDSQPVTDVTNQTTGSLAQDKYRQTAAQNIGTVATQNQAQAQNQKTDTKDDELSK